MGTRRSYSDEGRSAEGRYVVLDVVRGRWETFERERVIVSTAAGRKPEPSRNSPTWARTRQNPRGGGPGADHR